MRFVSLLLGALVACGGPPPASDASIVRPEILEVRAPSPALEGSILEVRVLGAEALGSAPRLELARGGAPFAELAASPSDGSTLLFELSAEAVAFLGAGRHALEVRVLGAVDSLPFAFELRLVTELPVDLFEAPFGGRPGEPGQAHRNDVGVVTGNGILAATEGEVRARFLGTFTPDAGGAPAPVDVELPVAPVERGDRERGAIVLTTDLGGLFPGTFDGTIQLRSRLRSGAQSESAALPLAIHFNPPVLLGVDPTEASLGQILQVTGGGFLGGPERPTETTLLRIEGAFTPAGGGTPEAFGPVELVPRFVSGNVVELVIEPEVRGNRLVSALFGHARGEFSGTATPITILGTEELEGDTVPFTFRLGPLRQVVYVRFLPGFYDGLRRFGLASAAPQVIDAVRERMEGIYAEWNVDFRFEEPDDFARTAYSVVEIGGADPNGVGLFGYDNTPGKDVGNLRLFDAIGGANAQTQMDGYPGYGGVFVESMLYWSSHPDLPGERPIGAPDPDPLFDEVFDPVRAQPATRAEALREGDPARVAVVTRAIRALGYLIGETAAHEIGHSLGLAQPYGPPTVYHNDFDGEGCLMDSGGDRPLGERMGEPGYAPTRFCHDHPSYLSDILGR